MCEQGRRRLKATAPALTVLLAACGPDVGWQHATALPFRAEHGIEIAESRSWRPWRAPASLSLVCDQAGAVRLMLHAKLPGPKEFQKTGRDEDAVVFVGDIEHKIPMAFDVIAIGRVDEIISDRLLVDKLAQLSFYYRDGVPQEISVGGIQETTVFMRGKGSRTAITEFSRRCSSALD